MNKETIGPRVKKIRKKKGLTQAQLAKDLGYSHKSVITHIEKGESEMSYETMLLHLKTYLIDENELFDTSDDMKRLDELIEDEHNRTRSDKVVVYIHGLYGSYKEAEEYKYIKGYDIKGLDYSDGNPWEVGPIIKEKFKEIIKPYKEVVVIASSIGAFYAYEYLYEFDIKHAFFISPIASMRKILFDYIVTGKVNKDELKEKKYITLDDGTVLSYDFYEKYSINDYHGQWDTLTDILYGNKDELMYIENIADFLSHHPNSRLTIYSDGRHYLHNEEDKQFIKNWINKSI